MCDVGRPWPGSADPGWKLLSCAVEGDEEGEDNRQ